MVKKVLIALIVVMLAAALIAGALWVDFQRFADRPADTGGPAQTLIIRPGQPVSETADQLVRTGIVASALKFRILARLTGADRRLKAGEYELSAAMPPRELLSVLERGLVKLHRLTIPEGLTLRQIAEAVEASGLATATDLLAVAADPAVARRYGIPVDSLEGYLFPDTYLFPRSITAGAIVAAMHERFRAVFTAEWSQRAAALGLSVHETVTLASIIEKETGAPAERPLIASVFHNRLRKGMRLETDPTVIYGIEDFDGNLTRRHLATPTPYNTYIIRGLPPGPIANPGREALHAALFPADSPYLFFVSRNDGTHVFSTHLEEHNRAVQTYQRRPSRARPLPDERP